MKNYMAKMAALDIYLSNTSNEQYEDLKPQIEKQTLQAMPLLSWDFFMNDFHKRKAEASKYYDLKQILDFSEKFNWANDIKKAFTQNSYEALILTDERQNILWVNEGFTTMTGYSKRDALDRTPRFLQGAQTSLETKKRIKQKLQLNKPFNEVIINHRKDKSIYKCEVNIVPLYTKDEKTTHYIAFEKLAS